MESITKVITFDSGEKVEFSRLDLYDLFGLADEVTSEREAVARQLGREEKLDKFEVMNLVLETRSRKTTVQEILQSISSPQGAFRALAKSLTKSKVEGAKHKDIISKLSIPDAIELSRMLVLDVQEEKKAEEAKVESPLPVVQSSGTESSTPATPSKDDAPGYYGKPQPTP